MPTGEKLIHTKLFSEDAYQIISVCKKARYAFPHIFSLDRGSLFFIHRTWTTDDGVDYQVLRAPNGEVLVYHPPSRWGNADSLDTIRDEVRDFIRRASRVVGEDERFVILPTPVQESEYVTSDCVKRRMKASCCAASRFLLQPKTFVYEKNDIDYIYSHPFTLRRLKDALGKIGSKAIGINEDDDLDPFIIEQRKMILRAFIRLYEDVYQATANTYELNALRDISTMYSITVDECGEAVLHDFNSALPIALKVNLKEDVLKFVDDFEGSYFISRKDAVKEELDRDLFSTEAYRDFLSALEIASDVSYYKFPSPALVCSHWRDYKAVL